ncbi:MAG: ATP-binding cassette domain-containing protein [Polyangiaceae bacterium]|nr:ATP-binding cassette domain-containing protein [Polyangiaceae bacterium]
MIGTSNLGKSFGARTLFAGVSLSLSPGSRYGLVGANGSGKTTFLKILSGDEPASEGTVAITARARVGVLRQDLFLDDAQIILDLAMMGDETAWKLLRERTRIIDHGEGDAAHLGDIEHALQNAGGYTLEPRAGAILVGLGIPTSQHRLPLSTLSGGFKLRVLLARVLLGGPDVLLLDEPTNHLDILSIRWLEKFLASYRGTAIIISHDQRFLDNVTTHILDVDYETITSYVGNYGAFAIQKKATRERKESEIARQEKIIASKLAFVERFGAKATKAKQAQSRLKQIEKIEVEELAQSSRRAPLFRFTQERPSGREVLTIEHVSKSYGKKQVLSDVSLAIRRGEKVAIIGPNGLGKSTLLKIVMGRLEADGGETKFGYEVRASYFAQDHHELFDDPKMKPIDFVWNAIPTEATSYVRGQLGRMLFSGDDVEKPIMTLSGGEAARLIFARIIVEKPNLLVLDEPTNHLDLEAIFALTEGLRTFDGTVFFVSHDRFFVSEIATRIIEVMPEGVRDFPGRYTEYLEQCGDDHLDAEAIVLKAKKDKPAEGDAANTAWEEQKKRKNRISALPQKRDKVLMLVEEAEARKKAICAMYTAPGFFDRTPKAEQDSLEKESAELDKKIEVLMTEWEAIEAEIATSGGT